MRIKPTLIPEVLHILPDKLSDNRGYFAETFVKAHLIKATGKEISFVQENVTKSKKGVIRGLHFQLPPYAQSKLVMLVHGRILDVAVDIRVGSPTFGKFVCQILDGSKKEQLFIPRGFAHGFACLSGMALMVYKMDNYYNRAAEQCIQFNDPDLSINWRIPLTEQILSEKDLKQGISLKKATFFSFHDEQYH